MIDHRHPIAPTLDAAKLRELARDLVARRDAALRGIAEARTVQRDNGWSYNLHADYHEGSAAAYALACSLLVGWTGVETIGNLTDSIPTPRCSATIDGTDEPCPWPVDRPRLDERGGDPPTVCAYHRPTERF